MITVELTKHEAKVLRRLLTSDREDFIESLKTGVKALSDGANYFCDSDNSVAYLMRHTADAVDVIDAIVDQIDDPASQKA